jgi:hypothetical protein
MLLTKPCPDAQYAQVPSHDAEIAAHEFYAVIAIGMLVTGCGAGLLNGETAKVSMSVIPPERGGMASGISGTLRFIGLVTGITGLGVILASGTQAHFIRTVAISGLSGSVADGAQIIVSRIISGDIAGALEHVAPAARAALIEVSRGSFAAGFTSVLIVAGGIAALGALLTALLVCRAGQRLACPGWTDRRGPKASGHVQKVEVICAAFSFSSIQAWDGIASDDHPVHSSTNDIEWSAMKGGKRKGSIHACRPSGGLRWRLSSPFAPSTPPPSRSRWLGRWGPVRRPCAQRRCC